MRPNHTPVAVTSLLARKEQAIYARFWANVNKTDECWLWTHTLDGSGYGRVHFAGPSHPRAHRFSFEMEYGPIPTGMVVMHTCDNPPCVRPEHLEVGSIADNNADRDGKGRGKIARRGEDNPKSKLTEVQVREIRSRWTGEWGQASALCREYGIKAPALYGVIRRTTWRHISP